MNTSLKDKALRLLGVRAHSKEELRRKLRKHEENEEHIEKVLSELEAEAYLNDAEFARAWVEESLRRRPGSRMLFTKRLEDRGVSSEHIAQALEEVYPAEAERHVAMLILEKATKRTTADSKKNLATIGRKLSGKGFSEGLIWEILEEKGLTRSG